MNIHEVLEALTASIPIVLFLSVIVGMVLFVKYKGTIDALRDAANTYEQVAAAYKEQVEQLKDEVDALNAQIAELKRVVDVQREAIDLAAERIYNLVAKKVGETK